MTHRERSTWRRPRGLTSLLGVLGLISIPLQLGVPPLAVAQAQEGNEPPKDEDAAADSPTAAKEGDGVDEGAGGEELDLDDDAPPTFGDLDPDAPVGDCPGSPDPSEIELLERLRQRRLGLDEREEKVRVKEELVAQLERELSRRVREAVAEVERLEKRLELGEFERQAREAKLNSLAASIATLRPSKAAPILERTDPILTVLLLMRVGTKRAGELLAKMEPRRAAALVDRLARGRTAAQLAAALVESPRRRKRGR